jgi:hypothetical protein
MAENSPISGFVDESAPSEIDHTTVSFMEKTMARVGKMRANTTVSNEKKEMLRASLTETEKESVKATMAEVEANPVEGHLDQSVMLQEQVKIRNAKFNS